MSSPSSPLLVQALALLSAPALATAAVAGLRLRRVAAGAGQREAVLRQQIAELEVERATLQRTASCDPLTGVWNYRHLQLTLGREVERTRRADHGEEPPPLALLMLEIAGFDAIVAEHGRGRAGTILRDLAQRLGVEIRRTDTLARYGGEEFLVVLPDTGFDGAVHVAERLCWSVRRHRLLDWSAAGPEPSRPVGGNGLTAAVGIAVLPGDGGHAALLLRAADLALARARAAGGDCWRGTGEGPRDHPDEHPRGHPLEHVSALDEPGSAVRDKAHGAAGDTADEAPEITGNLSVCAGGAARSSVSTAHTASAVTVTREGGS
ncbi:GGDEF domain-containing protein [Kitasatospora sp. MAP5-34]|uniref:GGDEF domain-containing protein n=1 Tax=Kitasatospora sp. MAP5-34 TaxID=3035102 RepID=UPI0024742463|nr:GGDEF domain-containing protein [Kitasatospora sp. MAP5-34]MDH6577043.1 diguanylate cyclase (GGDEF)-like protein [Kitasatospora sp. MAP5-34]